MLYLAGIFITFFLAIILLGKKGKTTADHVLAAWLCVMGVHLFLFYFQITGNIYDYPYLLGIQIPLPLLQGPLLYIYTLTATRNNKFSNKYWLHFIPAAAAFIVLSKFFLLSDTEKINVYKNAGAGFEVQSNIILISLIISGFTYVLLSYRELMLYKERIASEYSNTERINLNWLRYLMFGILAIWLVIVFDGGDKLIFGVVVIFVLLLGYFGIKQVGIFTYRQAIERKAIMPAGQENPGGIDNINKTVQPDTANDTFPAIFPKEDPPTGQSESKKYESSGLQKETAGKIHQQLVNLMQKEKVFKEAELSLADLAKRLEVHPNNLSQVINSYENKNFYDYINSLRIEEFKRIVNLPDNKQYTLLSLAFECGFNAKTSFNRNFKKITGQSPSEYLKKANIQIA